MTLTAAQLRRLRQMDTPATGNKVAAAFDLAATTQRDAAEQTGLSYVYVSDVARGKYQTITVENGRKFAEYFGCAIEDLFPARQEVA